MFVVAFVVYGQIRHAGLLFGVMFGVAFFTMHAVRYCATPKWWSRRRGG